MLIGESAICEFTVSDCPGPPEIDSAIAVDVFLQAAIAVDLQADVAITVQVVTQPDH
jgi:hypothetical protein